MPTGQASGPDRVHRLLHAPASKAVLEDAQIVSACLHLGPPCTPTPPTSHSAK